MKTRNEYLSDLMKLAWQFRKATGVDFAICLSKAWSNMKLTAKMQEGIVKFHFQKVDGSIREAWGTLKDVEDTVKGTDTRKKNPFVQAYYDTEKEAWRAFKKFNLVA